MKDWLKKLLAKRKKPKPLSVVEFGKCLQDYCRSKNRSDAEFHVLYSPDEDKKSIKIEAANLSGLFIVNLVSGLPAGQMTVDHFHVRSHGGWTFE